MAPTAWHRSDRYCGIKIFSLFATALESTWSCISPIRCQFSPVSGTFNFALFQCVSNTDTGTGTGPQDVRLGRPLSFYVLLLLFFLSSYVPFYFASTPKSTSVQIEFQDADTSVKQPVTKHQVPPVLQKTMRGYKFTCIQVQVDANGDDPKVM